MASARAAVVAAAVMAVLWLCLDSRLLVPEPAPASTSAALAALGLLFGAGAWGFAAGGRQERSPLLAGLGAGVVVYAGLRLVLS